MRKLFYGWWVVSACFLFSFFVDGAAVFGFSAFFEPIAKQFGWSYTQISLAASLRGMELGIFAPIMGFLVDRFGAKRLLLSATVLVSSGFFLLSRIHTIGMFYIAFILIGLGSSASGSTVMTTAVANWFKKDAGKALGILACGMAAGGILVAPIASLIYHYQWRTAYVILGFGMLIFGLPLSLVIRHRPEAYGYLPDGATTDGPTSVTEIDREINWRAAVRTRVFWHLGISEAIRLMIAVSIITHVIPYLSSLGISRNRATMAATLIPVISIFGRLLFGWLGDKFDRCHVMAIAYFLGGVSAFIFAYAKNTWLLYLFLILYPLSWGAPALRGAILRERFGRLALGSILGLLAGLGSIARMLGPTVTGWTYDTFGRYHFIWFFYAVTFAIAVILMLTVPPLQPLSKDANKLTNG